MIRFECKGSFNNKEQSWRGYITKLVYYGSHLEISIQLAEPITAVVCKAFSGFFVYFTHFESGFNLPSLFDIDGNAGNFMQMLDVKDAVTVANAIGKVGYFLSTPRRRKRRHTNFSLSEEIPF